MGRRSGLMSMSTEVAGDECLSFIPAMRPAAPPSPEFTINQARALFDGAAYQEMIAMVARAWRSVRLEFFLFSGPIAAAIIDLLVRKRATGVRVQVTLDRARGMLPQLR